MRSIFLIAAIATSLAACSANPPATSNAPVPERPEKARTVISHNTESETSPIQNVNAAGTESGTKSKWTQGGDAIDTSGFDASIAAAEKDAKAKPSDEAAKKELSQAYYQRAVALTDARQYASALGDYRRALKYDPSNADAKNWIDQIIMIYDSMNKEYPPEGQEPPPLPFKGK
jgi:tetratricopeptide (TPR) repeat protein